MQCAACLEVYPDVLDACPLCPDSETDTPPAAAPAADSPGSRPRREADAPAMTDNSNVSTQTTPAASGSTLIEFPGVNRNRPAWRKELSERFREIQQRRAREAALEAEAEMRVSFHADAHETPASVLAARESEANKQLGLVPPPPAEAEPNPIVVKALRRLERARQQAAPAPRAGSSRGHAATAAARVIKEEPLEETERLPAPVQRAAEQVKPARAERPERAERAERPASAESARAASLLVVQQMPAAEPKPAPAAALTQTAPAVAPAPPAVRPETETKAEPKVETKAEVRGEPKAETKVEARVESKVETRVEAKAVPAPPRVEAAASVVEVESAAKPQPRKVSGVIDDHWLERRGVELLPQVEAAEVSYDDRAPRVKRLAAALFDLLAVAFLCAPCAAVIELTIGDWSEPRVLGSMGGIVLLVMFLYHTCSVALASRTFGMKVFGLHVVDGDTARVPTTWQCARRALVYILSLASFGLGILYSLIDAEGRTAHDLLSGTVVVKE